MSRSAAPTGTQIISKVHPTHAKGSLKAMLLILLVSILPFAFGFYAANRLRDEFLETASALSFMLLWGCLILIGGLRLYLGRCPECRGWILRRRTEAGGGLTVKFACEKCGIIWDSTIAIDD